MTEQAWQSWEVLLLTASAESFLMLFVDASIDERTQHILCHSRNNAEIYWGNGKWKPMNCLFFDEIRHFFSSLFYKLTKRRSDAADQMSWVLSHVICWRQHWSSNWTYFASLQEGSSNSQNHSPSGTKSTNSFVIRFQICSLFTKYNWSGESFFISLVDTSINQSKQHIPYQCRKDPVNNRGNWPA